MNQPDPLLQLREARFAPRARRRRLDPRHAHSSSRRLSRRHALIIAMVRALLPLGAALLGATTVLAADPPSCSLSQKCPKEAPCCSRELELLLFDVRIPTDPGNLQNTANAVSVPTASAAATRACPSRSTRACPPRCARTRRTRWTRSTATRTLASTSATPARRTGSARASPSSTTAASCSPCPPSRSAPSWPPPPTCGTATSRPA